jgi:CBS domain-containing protein
VEHKEITGRHITLEEVMRPAISVRQDARARDALKVMLDNGVPGVPVVNDRGYVIGFVNDAHLLASTLPSFVTFVDNLPRSPEGADGWVRYNRSAVDRPVGELMDREVPEVDLEHSEIVAAHKMVHEGTPCVVVTDAGRVVGIVTRTDLYKAITSCKADLHTAQSEE